MNIIDRYFCVQIFLWFYIFFVLQLPTLSDFCEWILFFTISDAGHDWQVQTHELYEKLVSNQRSKEHVASLKTSAEFGVYLRDLIRPALQIFKNVHLKFIAAKVIVSSTVESRNDHRVTRTPEPSRRQLLACVASFYDIHGSLSCTYCTEVGE